PVLCLVDLGALPRERREREAERQARAAAWQPFDLARGPLLRAALVRLASDDHVALLALHHIVADGWSLGVLVREVEALYGALVLGLRPALPALPVQPADFALWQREHLSGDVLAGHLAWWREHLAGAPADLDLPFDRPQAGAPGRRGAQVATRLPAALVRELERRARGEGATLFMLLLAALEALLARVTGQEDFVVGSVTAGRNRVEIEGLVGFFVQTLALRAQAAGDPPFDALLARVRAGALGAWSHQDLPFEKLVEELRPERRPLRAPLFQVVLALQNAAAPAAALELPGLSAESLAVGTGGARFDLYLSLAETAEGLAGSWEYDPDLFDAPTVLRLARHFENLVAGVAAPGGARLSALPLLTAEETHQVLLAWNDSATAYPRERSIHELFAEQASRRPEAVAVELGESALSYGDLARRAHQLARHLRGLGVAPGDRVGLCVERSLEMVVALVGILEAGAAYVALDPELPRERLAFLLRDMGIGVVLTLEGLRDRLPDGPWIVPLDGRESAAIQWESGPAPESGASPESVAYVSYTSGSTGLPKGVAVPHRAVIRLVRGARGLALGEDEVFLQLSPLAFDASTLEIWGPLLNGGRLAVMPPGAPSLEEIGAALERHGVTTLWLTAGLFHQRIESAPERLAGLRQLLAGGDVLSVPHVRRALAALPRTRLLNGYGPTENTTFTAIAALEPDADLGASVPLGRPVANTSVYILDRALRPVPPGVWGELCAGGDGLAQGYLGRPGLTAERFVPNPVGGTPGARLYRTGDIARFRADGRIDFRGRADRQVKLRGFRVEPGEVEAALAALPGVREAAVAVREDLPGGRGLAAWVVAGEGVELTPGALRAELRHRLPDSLIPGRFTLLAELPLTPNGKVDRQALALQPLAGGAEESARPRTPFEELLATVWADVLGREQVGPDDDFFELGGHSLLATRIVSRLRSLLGVDLPLRRLFEEPTVAGLARAVQEALDTAGESAGGDVPLVRRPRGARPPLSFAQERLWILDRFEPGNAAFNVATAVVLRGELARPALARSLDEVVRRHEALRTRFAVVDGVPYQEIAEAAPLPLPEIDLAALPEGLRARELRRLENAQAALPFDLEHGPLFAGWLVRLAAGEQALLVNLHHIVADGWSLGVLVSELAALYAAFSEGRPSPLPELPVQYADFAAWQREWLAGERLAAQLAWWRGRLAGELPVLDLPL
ncbi:MAG TPA: amino acid adenylation domain-containing protein, partial [Thermoanaerobaculia bacterium]|nr:amino acid adenylation domain-containing protein [Thermoanaerobaculia bacterium]